MLVLVHVEHEFDGEVIEALDYHSTIFSDERIGRENSEEARRPGTDHSKDDRWVPDSNEIDGTSVSGSGCHTDREWRL